MRGWGQWFAETRKAWAAAAATFGSYYGAALEDGVTSQEWLTAVVFTIIAWILTWAVPNRAPTWDGENERRDPDGDLPIGP